MKKAFLIGWKDLTLAFRDRAALTFMLLAPFLLTIGLGLVTGRFSGDSTSSGVSDIPIMIINEDAGKLGVALVDVLQSGELADLLEPSLVTNRAEALAALEADETAAVILIPAGFSESILPAAGRSEPEGGIQLQLYSNPARPTSVGVIRTILDGFISQVEVGRVSGQVIVGQLIASGRIQPQEAAEVGFEVGQSQAQTLQAGAAITLESVTTSGEDVPFDVLAVLAPGMALMFLMYTVSNGGRSLLLERTQGTLPRLMITPTTTGQVLAGKTIGIYLTGVAQMLILILASTVLFQVRWGDPLGILTLVLASVVGAVGWGLLITAIARTPGQVAAIGSAVMLTFGIMGGTFVNTEFMPDWFRIISRITPNAWGVDAFTTLALGGSLGNILTPILVLLAMGALLFVVAILIFNRRGLTQT